MDRDGRPAGVQRRKDAGVGEEERDFGVVLPGFFFSNPETRVSSVFAETH